MTDCYGPGCRLELPDEGPPWFHSETCQKNFMESINRAERLDFTIPPPAPQQIGVAYGAADQGTVRTVESFELVSTDQHGQPAMRNVVTTQADVDEALAGLAAIEAIRDEAFRIRDEVRASAERLPERGWLSRLLDRMFRRTT